MGITNHSYPWPVQQWISPAVSIRSSLNREPYQLLVFSKADTYQLSMPVTVETVDLTHRLVSMTVMTVDPLRWPCRRYLDREPQHCAGRQQDPYLGQRRSYTNDGQREAHF